MPADAATAKTSLPTKIATTVTTKTSLPAHDSTAKSSLSRKTAPTTAAKTAGDATEGNPGLPVKKTVAESNSTLPAMTAKTAAAAEASSSLSAKTITEGKLSMPITAEASSSLSAKTIAEGKLSMPVTAKDKLGSPQLEQRWSPPHTLLQGNTIRALPSIQLPQGVKRINESALKDLVKGPGAR